MLTGPLTGVRYPEQTDGPLGGLQIGNAVKDLEPVTFPYYTTASARDTAFAAWVTAGGTMRNGLHSNVAGIDYVYRSGQWRSLAPTHGTTTFTTDGSGLGYINHGLGAVPARAQLTLVFTTDEVCEVAKLTRGTMTTTQVQVVAFRTDSSARLTGTPLTVDWAIWL